MSSACLIWGRPQGLKKPREYFRVIPPSSSISSSSNNMTCSFPFCHERDGHNMLIRTRNHYYSTYSSKRGHSRQHSKGPHSSTYPCLPIAVTIRLTVWAILSFSIIINIIPSLALRGWKRKVVYYCSFYHPFFFPSLLLHLRGDYCSMMEY